MRHLGRDLAWARKYAPWTRTAVVIALAAVPWGAARAAYTVERLVTGLNQPTYMTQAPGDNTSLYIVERADTGNQLGRISRYDLQTHVKSTFLDLSGTIASDGGALSMTFSPNYQSSGLFYVVSNNNGTNGLDEYKTVGGVPQFQRRLMQYQNLNNVYHTMNQAAFRPNGNNNELYLTTGDGGTQADDPGFNPALIESSTSPYGKIMKIDLTQPFATPAAGPGPGVSVFAKGIRNPFRSGFDRQTGDFYFGDVGFNTAESIDFIPASSFTNPPASPLDFGWTDREGTIATIAPFAGGPGSPGDINPIFDYAHGGQPLPHPSQFSGQSVTGGYVYRGPVAELQGRYFFADFTNGNVYSGLFNNTTPVSSFNGTNLTNVTNHTTAFESLVGGGANIQYVTSFGEDNSGNLYIVKFGDGFFPPLGQGEIYRISAASALNAVVNRNTGAITLTNDSAAPISLKSLSISSAFGALNPVALTPISGHYDLSGDASVDNNNSWSITSTPGSFTLLSESSNGDPGTLGIGQKIVLSPGSGWTPSTHEDIAIALTTASNAVVNASVAFAGNGGQAFSRSDLNFDGALTAADWSVFVNGASANLAGLSPAQAYGKGDLDGDGDNDYSDFKLFKSDYVAVNGLAAFEQAVLGVPEPSTWALCLVCVGWFKRNGGSVRRRERFNS